MRRFQYRGARRSIWTKELFSKEVEASAILLALKEEPNLFSTLGDANTRDDNPSSVLETSTGDEEHETGSFVFLESVPKHHHCKKKKEIRVFLKSSLQLLSIRYIEEDDLLRFLEKEEVQSIPLFHGTVENRKIKKKYFRNYVVPQMERIELNCGMGDASQNSKNVRGL
ncbi:hypothetical protein AAC387_Pa06g2150 [Persea americana]